MMQPQQQQAPPAAWNPAAAVATVAAAGAGGNKDAMYDAAFSIGREFFISNTARMVPGLESTMMSLRYYFAVDNKYVVLKMKKILLPFISKQWRRLVRASVSVRIGWWRLLWFPIVLFSHLFAMEQYQEKEPEGPNPSTSTQYGLPKVDENAPDLYLPLMSLITYVLLCAVCYGTAGKFNPEVIPDVTTKCFATQVLEVLAIRFGFYMMQAPIAFLDLFSYTGYKYLGLCINMVVGLVLGHFGLGATGYYITFVWTGVAASYFMLKTMANNIPVVTSATGPKREMMVLAFAASQFATMWFVSQTKFL